MADQNPSAASEPPPHYDLATCSHRHAILATAVEADQGCPVPVTLFHWRPPTVRAKITLVMTPDVLPAIEGFVSLGTFSLPGDFDAIFRILSELLEAAGTPASQEPTPQLFADLMISRLATPDQGQGSSSRLRFFSFPVFSNSPTEIFSDGLLPVWKWVKPEQQIPQKRLLGGRPEHGYRRRGVDGWEGPALVGERGLGTDPADHSGWRTEAREFGDCAELGGCWISGSWRVPGLVCDVAHGSY